MIPALLFALQAASAVAPAPAASDEARFDHCLDLAADNPAKAIDEANAWRLSGGNFLARQCLGMAYTHGQNFPAAAAEFEGAARAAEVAKDTRAANYWAQAGNAWLAANEPAEARAALDAALAAGTLSGLNLGEARLDRARALVAAGELEGARGDIDAAMQSAGADPFAWLLSATLARRMDDLPRAKKDIAEALRRSADDASVQLEAGNIAAKSGEEAYARAAWGEAVKLAPNSDAGRAAADALKQFATPAL